MSEVVLTYMADGVGENEVGFCVLADPVSKEKKSAVLYIV